MARRNFVLGELAQTKSLPSISRACYASQGSGGNTSKKKQGGILPWNESSLLVRRTTDPLLEGEDALHEQSQPTRTQKSSFSWLFFFISKRTPIYTKSYPPSIIRALALQLQLSQLSQILNIMIQKQKQPIKKFSLLI